MTYHGGIENISFEWGMPSAPSGAVSPDDIAQRILVKEMAIYAGELYPSQTTSKTTYDMRNYYDTGDMNDILYPVRGGFEDWVYASSWINNNQDIINNQQCQPKTYGGYESVKTKYDDDDASLSTFNILIEISNEKNLPSDKYGTDYKLLSNDLPFLYDGNTNNGYVAKNIRTSLMAIDAVEPYVEIFQYAEEKESLLRELRPLTMLTDRWCRTEKTVAYEKSLQSYPEIRWSVGGAFVVDETFLIYGLWKNFPDYFNCINQLNETQLETVLLSSASIGGGTDNINAFTATKKTTGGGTRWSRGVKNDNPDGEGSDSIYYYKESIDLDAFAVGDEIAVFAVAIVDQNWKNLPTNAWPAGVSAQSHMVNIRTNPLWTKSKPQINRSVQGRLHWISIPLTINII